MNNRISQKDTAEVVTLENVPDEIINLNKKVCEAMCSSALVTAAYHKWLPLKKTASALLADLLNESEPKSFNLKYNMLKSFISIMESEFAKFGAACDNTLDTLAFTEKKIQAIEGLISSAHPLFLHLQFQKIKFINENIKDNLNERNHVKQDHQDILDAYRRIINFTPLKPSSGSLFQKQGTIPPVPVNNLANISSAPLKKDSPTEEKRSKTCSIF